MKLQISHFFTTLRRTDEVFRLSHDAPLAVEADSIARRSPCLRLGLCAVKVFNTATSYCARPSEILRWDSRNDKLCRVHFLLKNDQHWLRRYWLELDRGAFDFLLVADAIFQWVTDQTFSFCCIRLDNHGTLKLTGALYRGSILANLGIYRVWQ